MQLTIYSGTFNPIHTAHLIIAEAVRLELKLEKILFIPAFNPPHRDNNLASPEDRMNMLNLAISDNKYFESSYIEYELGGKSYSYDTVTELIKRNPEIKGQINFIIGADAFSLIDSWYNPDKLAELVNFIIIARPNCMNVKELIKKVKLKDFNYTIVATPLIEISSSYIRSKLKTDKSIKYLVPKRVEEYIYKNKIYLD